MRVQRAGRRFWKGYEIMLSRVAALVGLVVVYHALPYVLKRRPIMKRCFTCHNTINPNHTYPSASFGWFYRDPERRVFCIDHVTLDGARAMRKIRGLNVVLDRPQRAPSIVLCSRPIASLVHREYTKYEVFCAIVGQELKRRYPELTHVRHVSVDHTKKDFVIFGSSSMAFVDAPIGEYVHITDLPKLKLFGVGGVLMLAHTIGLRPASLIYMTDMRFMYDNGIVLDSHSSDMYGNDVTCWRTTIVKTNDTYYAIPPHA